MADFSDLFRRSVDTACASFEPSPELPERIARRTLQLQRRRRGRVVAGTTLLGLAVLALPLVITPRFDNSDAVTVPLEPAAVNNDKQRKSTTTDTATPATNATNALRRPDLSGLGPKARAEALRKFDQAKKRRAEAHDDPEVEGIRTTRATPGNAPGDGSSAPGPTSTTRRGATNTTRATTTTRPPTTTTTSAPPTTTTTAPPIVPLQIVPPDHVCAGVPAEFRATGTGVEQVVWSNLQVGPVATYVLTESANIVATLDLNGSVTSKQLFVAVTPTGTPPC